MPKKSECNPDAGLHGLKMVFKKGGENGSSTTENIV